METMKQTGVQWIGEIPSTWDLIRTKHFSYMKGRIGWQGLTADEFIEEGPYLVTGTDFENGRVCWERSYHISEKRYDEAPQIQLTVGDLLVTKDGTIGKLAYIDQLPGKASLNSHLLVMRPLKNKYINRFLYWMLSSSVFIEYYTTASNGSTMDSLSQEKMGDFVFPTPPIDEQEAIADFLDEHCGKLDGIIADLEKQIETLKAYKKSLITETVTKGLNKNAPMKDSGISWIGQIPKHWDVKRLKYMLEDSNDNMRVGPFGSALSTADYTESGYWVYTQRTVLDDNFISNDTYIDESKYKELIGFSVKSGDILITTRGTIGKVAIVPEKHSAGVLHPCIIRFRMNPKMLSHELLKIIFNDSDFISKQFVYMSNATTIDVIYSYSLKDIVLPVIPLDEQNEIIQFLLTQCRIIDETLTEKQTQLKKMQLHRSSLIFEYVTGKKRVKEVQ